MTTSSITEGTTRATPQQRTGAPVAGAADAAPRTVGDRGHTSIEGIVVRKIAGAVTRQVPGVHDLGTGGTRAFGSARQRIPGSGGPSVAQGVSVEVGEREAAVDLDVVVDFGTSIPLVTDEIRRSVTRSIEHQTGLQVVEVNVAVDDVYVPPDSAAEPSRVS